MINDINIGLLAMLLGCRPEPKIGPHLVMCWTETISTAIFLAHEAHELYRHIAMLLGCFLFLEVVPKCIKKEYKVKNNNNNQR